MWPPIKRENNIGVCFDEKFWEYWGPSNLFYFNENIFQDNREIKCIFCTYEPHRSIQFKAEEIAIGLCYECGDFGEHTVLFSYVEEPSLVCNHNWDYCVYSDFSSDYFELLNLWQEQVLKNPKQKSSFFDKFTFCREENNLNEIFNNALVYFQNKVIMEKEILKEELELDLETNQIIKTGKMVKAFTFVNGKLIQEENGMAKFLEIKKEVFSAEKDSCSYWKKI